MINANPGLDPGCRDPARAFETADAARAAARGRARASSSTCRNTGCTTRRRVPAGRAPSRPIRSASARWTGARRSARRASRPRSGIPRGIRRSRCGRSMRGAATSCGRVRAGGPRRSARPFRDAARHHGQLVHDPRHQQSRGCRHAGHARLHAALSRGHRGAVRGRARRHAGAHHQQARSRSAGAKASRGSRCIPPLQEDAVTPPSLTDMLRVIVSGTSASGAAIDWQRAMAAWREHRGIPEPVGRAARIVSPHADRRPGPVPWRGPHATSAVPLSSPMKKGLPGRSPEGL